MCKVQVTCYISLMLVIVANCKPFTSPYKEYLRYAIDDVKELEKMNIAMEKDDFYTPEDFTNEERRMKALEVYMAEMKVLQAEFVEKKDIRIKKDIFIDHIIKNLCVFAEKRRMETLGVYMDEMKVSQAEIVEEKEVQISKEIGIDNIKNLCVFAKTNAELKCEGCQQKNAQEFLKGLRELLQTMYSSLVTLEHH